MKRVLIFAGTTEGRQLAERLSQAGIPQTICVATEYGEIVLQDSSFTKVHRGRMNADEMRDFIMQDDYVAVVDATHPYACEVTKNIRQAVSAVNEHLGAISNNDEKHIPYIRLVRDTGCDTDYEKLRYFESNEDCAKALEQIEGNILLTTGSKELAKYCVSEELRKRLYVRVLPSIESIHICMEQGICGKQILALQGPFTEELNEALLRQYDIACMVTKESGTTGGYVEKIAAAKKVGIPVLVIGRPEEQEGLSLEEVYQHLKENAYDCAFEITLAGIGMGSKDCLTKEVESAIVEADILLGAERMIEQYTAHLEKKPYYLASQIIPYLIEVQQKQNRTLKVVILFSGDTGFFSGSNKLYQALQEAIEQGQLKGKVRVLAGISSIAYLAASLGASYQDATILSVHGKSGDWSGEVVDAVQHSEKTFLLVSGWEDMRRIGNLLIQNELGNCKIWAGYQLSYHGQDIMELTPAECANMQKEGLYTCLIVNGNAVSRHLTHGIADKEFIRDAVPMTKEEVRQVSICKLGLREDSVVYDIGSGTGSIAIEMARLSPKIQVYAIERKQEALALIKQNKEKFHTSNVVVVEAEAPAGLDELPIPTHAFIGGSGGRLEEVLATLYARNPKMRIVINAISMETIAELRAVLDKFPIEDEEIIQLQVSRARKAGKYHLMQGENPIWICFFHFALRETE